MKRIIHPIQRFIHDSRSVGITLLACTCISLILSNIGFWDSSYANFWPAAFSGSDPHHVHIGILNLPNSPLYVINDLFMAFFFLLAGMEIKRELVNGELSSIKKSLLPVIGAIGGMLAPAILFALFNKGHDEMKGWAIPTATDIAFTLGIASLLGNRVPATLKIFITALAIIDDLGAIIVIAIFYGGHLEVAYLGGCFIIVFVLWLLNKKKIQFGILQVVLGILLWYCMFNSGIHATVAGVVFAFMIPTDQLKKFELKLHHPVYFIIMPIFAFANTAIEIPDNIAQSLNGHLNWGILTGLCIGKPLGIYATCWFLVKKNAAALPRGVNWHKMIGAGILAGIGFTMSIFISTLAFPDDPREDIAKISVLIASILSMVIGYIWFNYEARIKQLLPIKK